MDANESRASVAATRLVTACAIVPLKPNELTPQERTDDDSRTSCVDVSSMPDTPRTRSPISGLSTRS
jgi:hypothetical protein